MGTLNGPSPKVRGTTRSLAEEGPDPLREAQAPASSPTLPTGEAPRVGNARSPGIPARDESPPAAAHPPRRRRAMDEFSAPNALSFSRSQWRRPDQRAAQEAGSWRREDAPALIFV